MIVLIIVICIIVYFIIPPSTNWIYSDINGNLIKIADIYKNIVTFYYIQIKNNNIKYISNKQNMPLSQFKLSFIRWTKL